MSYENFIGGLTAYRIDLTNINDVRSEETNFYDIRVVVTHIYDVQMYDFEVTCVSCGTINRLV